MLFVQLILAYMQYLDTEKDNINKLTLSNWINSDKSNILVIKRLIEVIKFLCKTDDVTLYIENIVNGTLNTTDKNYILINKSYKINRDNFEDFKNLVCEILDTEIKIEKKPQKKSEEEVNNQWIESVDARKMLRVSAKTWQTYRDERRIPFSQFGRKIYVKRADLEAFMEKHYINSRG